jgi:hypothetical protein
MNGTTEAHDARTDRQKTEMAQWWAEEQAEYRDADGYTIVDEDAQRVIVADHTGHEINEWASQFDADREALRATFRELAEDSIGAEDAHEAFSYSDPVVFDKLEN